MKMKLPTVHCWSTDGGSGLYNTYDTPTVRRTKTARHFNDFILNRSIMSHQRLSSVVKRLPCVCVCVCVCMCVCMYVCMYFPIPIPIVYCNPKTITIMQHNYISEKLGNNGKPKRDADPAN